MKKNWMALALIAAAFFLLPDLLSACPNCKEAYVGDGQTPVSSGFNASIYFMMAMPFVVFGGFTLRLWLAQRKRPTDGSQS